MELHIFLPGADVVARLSAIGCKPMPGTPAHFLAALTGDSEKHANIVKRARIGGSS